MNENKIIVALDSDDIFKTLELVEEIKEHAFAFKIGYEFFLNFGHEGYKKIQKKNVKIFLDLKLHDIPNTINNAIKAISILDPYFTTIHISGGDDMQLITNLNKNNVKVLGVSVLTSLDKKQTKKYYDSDNIEKLVEKFVRYSIENKLDGVVCSPLEIKIAKSLKVLSSNSFNIVTPGIRIDKSENDDQKRYMTPEEAVNLGADYLVIGRPITKTNNPLKKIISINSSIEKI